MASTDTAAVDQQASTADVPIYNAASAAHQHSHSCNDPSHHHHYPSFFDQDEDQLSAKNDMLMKRKAKKHPNQDVTRAEFIPGHQGNRNIDDLVDFINGSSSATKSSGSKKSKKKPPTTTN